MLISRRRTLRGLRDFAAINAALVLLAGCTSASTGTSSGLSAAAGEAETVVNAFILETPLIAAAFPTILSPAQAQLLTNANKTGFLDLASTDIQSLLTAISTGAVSDMTGAATLTTVEGYINQAIAEAAPVLTAACGVAPQCSDAQTVYKSIVLAAPLIEIFISSVLPSSQVAHAKLLSTRAAAVPSQGQLLMTPEAALAALRARFGK